MKVLFDTWVLVPAALVDQLDAIADVARQRLTSGIVYDHVSAALQASCSRIYTNNLAQFRSICPTGIIVSAP